LSLGGTCLASTGMYQMRLSELTELQDNLKALRESNTELQNLLEQSNQDSEIVRQQLEQSLANSKLLEQRITGLLNEASKAKMLSEQTETELRDANKSLQVYKKEVQSKIRSLTLQRDGLIVGIVYLALKRK